MDLIRAISFVFIVIGSLMCLAGSPNLNAFVPGVSLSSPEHMNVSSPGDPQAYPTPTVGTPTPHSTPTPDITPVVTVTPPPVPTVIPECPRDLESNCSTGITTESWSHILGTPSNIVEFTPHGQFLPDGDGRDRDVPAQWCKDAARQAFARVESLCRDYIKNSLSDPDLVRLGVNSTNINRYVGDCVMSVVQHGSGIGDFPADEKLTLAPQVVAYNFASKVMSYDGQPVWQLNAKATYYGSKYTGSRWYYAGIEFTFSKDGPCVRATYPRYSRMPTPSIYKLCPTHTIMPRSMVECTVHRSRYISNKEKW